MSLHVYVLGDCLVGPISQILNVSHIPYRMQAMRQREMLHTLTQSAYLWRYILYICMCVCVCCCSRSCGMHIIFRICAFLLRFLLFGSRFFGFNHKRRYYYATTFISVPGSSPDAKKRGSRRGVSGAQHREL